MDILSSNLWTEHLQQAQSSSASVRDITWKHMLVRDSCPYEYYWKLCKFVDVSIRKKIDDTPMNFYNNHDNSLLVYVADNIENGDMVIKGATFIMSFFRSISRSAIRPNVVIFLVDIPKQCGKGDVCLKSKNISSGVCYTNEKIIFIWRKEEVYKVLVHELVHAYGWDTVCELEKDTLLVHKKLSSIIGINKESSVMASRESITETITVLLCIIIDSWVTQKNAYRLLKRETSWAIQQKRRVWNFLKKEHSQQADALSYYVIKSMYLICILEWPTQFIPLFLRKIIPTEKRSAIFLITDIFANKSLFRRFIGQFKINSATIKGTPTTMRMSSPELLQHFFPM